MSVDGMICEVFEFRDGSLALDLLGNGDQEADLVFSTGCMRGDPALEKQRAFLEELVKAWEYYRTNVLEAKAGGAV